MELLSDGSHGSLWEDPWEPPLYKCFLWDLYQPDTWDETKGFVFTKLDFTEYSSRSTRDCCLQERERERERLRLVWEWRPDVIKSCRAPFTSQPGNMWQLVNLPAPPLSLWSLWRGDRWAGSHLRKQKEESQVPLLRLFLFNVGVCWGHKKNVKVDTMGSQFAVALDFLLLIWQSLHFFATFFHRTHRGVI